MAKSNLQGINTSDGAIGIELNEQEELILKANNLVIACRQPISHISGAITALPDVSSEGIFKQYISKDKDLNFYTVKAQEMETLASILHQHAVDTYKEFVDMDNIQAIQIANFILNAKAPLTSPISAEQQKELSNTQAYIRKNPKESFEKIKDALQGKPVSTDQSNPESTEQE